MTAQDPSPASDTLAVALEECPPSSPAREQELDLIRAAQAGDNAAYEQLLRPLEGALRSYVKSEISQFKHINPGEVWQEILIRGWMALARYSEEFPFRSYIFGIAWQVTRRFKLDRPKQVPTDWDKDSTSQVGEPPPSTVETLEESFRLLAGVERFPGPAVRLRSRTVFREMLAAMLWYGGYPHQQIAFGYSIMLWGKPKREKPGTGDGGARKQDAGARTKVPITGEPEQVVAELSDTRLDRAGRDFRLDLEVSENLVPEALDHAFKPFTYRLDLDCRKLFSRDATSAGKFKHMSHLRVGDTELKAYFGKNPRGAVANWTDLVKNRVRKVMRGEYAIEKSPLPMPAGDENWRSGQ